MRSRLGFLTANPCRHNPDVTSQRGVIVFRTTGDSPLLISLHAHQYAHTENSTSKSGLSGTTHVRQPFGKTNISTSRFEPELMTAIS